MNLVPAPVRGLAVPACRDPELRVRSRVAAPTVSGAATGASSPSRASVSCEAPIPIWSHVGSALKSGDITKTEMDELIAQFRAYDSDRRADALQAAADAAWARCKRNRREHPRTVGAPGREPHQPQGGSATAHRPGPLRRRRRRARDAARRVRAQRRRTRPHRRTSTSRRRAAPRRRRRADRGGPEPPPRRPDGRHPVLSMGPAGPVQGARRRRGPLRRRSVRDGRRREPGARRGRRRADRRSTSSRFHRSSTTRPRSTSTERVHPGPRGQRRRRDADAARRRAAPRSSRPRRTW